VADLEGAIVTSPARAAVAGAIETVPVSTAVVGAGVKVTIHTTEAWVTGTHSIVAMLV